MGAHPVLVLAPGHAQRHDDVTPAFFYQFLAGNGEILYPGHRCPLDGYCGVFFELVDSNGSHVDACESGIGDAHSHPSTSAAAPTPSPWTLKPHFFSAYWVVASVARISGALTAPMLPIRKIFPFR